MENKEKIISIMLASSLMLTAIGIISRKNESKEKERQTIAQSVESVINDIYMDKDNNCLFLDVLNDDQYQSITEDNHYTLYSKTKVYIKSGKTIVEELSFDKSEIVTVLAMNSKYAEICLRDGTIGYVEKDLLIKCPNLVKYNYEVVTDYKEKITNSQTYLYDNSGLYAGYLEANVPCRAVATNGEYTLITLANGNEAFVSSSALTNASKQINGYGLIAKDTILYYDKELQIPANYFASDNIAKIVYIENGSVCILNEETGGTKFVKLSDVKKNYIIINLEDQRIDCYINYDLLGSWYTRTGKDTTPTQMGLFDIDAKAADWEFSTFPGSYAKHWIPYNGGQGIHDLVGDDEENYGNELYHHKGSHGCVRVPKAASEFVYDNYREGDMVLVRKK